MENVSRQSFCAVCLGYAPEASMLTVHPYPDPDMPRKPEATPQDMSYSLNPLKGVIWGGGR